MGTFKDQHLKNTYTHLTVDLNYCYEAMVVSRHMLVYSLMRKWMKQFYSMCLR